MIYRLSSFQELKKYHIPFCPLLPSRLPASDITLRINDELWPTLRFLVKVDGEVLRVKEFFMDWFFTGFPKSLLSSFSDGYSDIEQASNDEVTVFSGRDYKSARAVAAYTHGTQVEVESLSKKESLDLKEVILREFEPEQQCLARISGLQFPDRSFFASGHPGKWFEEERISRLSWSRSSSKTKLHLGESEFQGSGNGTIKIGGHSHGIQIFQENNFSRVIWTEFVDVGIALSHPFYDIRQGIGFYDSSGQSDDRDISWIYRRNDGPGVVQFRGQEIITVAFSPGFKYTIIQDIIDSREKILNRFKEIFSPQTGHPSANH